jgi:hypothetical protein
MTDLHRLQPNQQPRRVDKDFLAARNTIRDLDVHTIDVLRYHWPTLYKLLGGCLG